MKSLAPYATYIIASLVLALGAIFGLAGCKTAPGTVTASIAVKYATAKYIEKAGDANAQAARAARVIVVLDQVDQLAAGDSVVVSALRAYVASRLPADLPPSDRVLAGALIDAAAAELEARIGEGVLSGDSALKVREVLKWVREGAAPYQSGS